MKIIITICAIIALTTSINAAPFLVCDPVLKTDPTAPILSYVLTGLPGSPVTATAITNADGSTQLHYDLSALANGTYTVTATATNQSGTGAASVPFTFTLAKPLAPTGLKLGP